VSVVAAALRELIALGVTGEALVAAVERIEQAATDERVSSVREAVDIASRRADDALQARKARAAERTRRWREKDKPSVTVTSPSVTVTHSDACDDAALSLPPSPRTPQPPTHTRECVSSRARHTREAEAREATGWQRFWDAYPRKIGKADARKAFGKAWKKLPPYDEEAILIGGLERAKAAWADAQFIPHAATWLNGERWQDEPDPPQTAKIHELPTARPDAKLAAKQANYARAWEGSERAARSRGEP
jgi:hypothetical protein